MKGFCVVVFFLMRVTVNMVRFSVRRYLFSMFRDSSVSTLFKGYCSFKFSGWRQDKPFLCFINSERGWRENNRYNTSENRNYCNLFCKCSPALNVAV